MREFLAGSARALLMHHAQEAGLDMAAVGSILTGELVDLEALSALWKSTQEKHAMPGTPIKPPAPPTSKTPTKPETPAVAPKPAPNSAGGLICKVCGNKVK